MAHFKLKIAGQTGEITSLFESTRDYCRRYLTEDPPDFTAEITREDLVFEQEQFLEEARIEGFRIRMFPEPFLERSAIQRKFAEHLFCRDTLLFHGSAVAVDGKGYLFTARSGTGKSTHTRLWRQVLGDRAVMINDDKPFLRLSESSVLVCGAPWSGKHGLDSNITVPLKGICILERGSGNRIRRIEPADGLERLRHETYLPPDPDCRQKFLQLVDTLAERVPLWHMECTKDTEAAAVAYRVMSETLT